MHTITSLFTRRGREGRRPPCAACGRMVGMFGPVWVEHADGTIEPASWHALSEDGRRTTSRAFHAGCFVPDYVPAWMRPVEACSEPAVLTLAAHRSFRLTATRWTTANRGTAAVLTLASAAVTALDAATIALHSAPV